MLTVFENGKLFWEGEFRQDQDLILQDGIIAGVAPAGEVTGDKKIPAKGLMILPGLIDLQINGCGGVTYNDSPCIDTLEKMRLTQLRSGTTTFMPTLVTCSRDLMITALQEMREYHKLYGSSSIPGIHLEGPFISPEKSGIHDKRFIRNMTEEDLKLLLEYRQEIGLITASPECLTSEQLTALKNAGIPLSAGHSNLSYDQSRDSLARYFTCTTHLFNAMTCIKNAREPGIMVAAQELNLFAGIIADACHVHPALVKMAYKLFKDHLFLVTDALASAGAPPDFSEFFFCGKKLQVRAEGYCSDHQGTLGGSSLTMNRGIRLLNEEMDISLQDAILMASAIPAKAAHLADHGTLRSGARGDFFLCRSDLHPVMTYCCGELVYTANPELTPGP